MYRQHGNYTALIISVNLSRVCPQMCSFLVLWKRWCFAYSCLIQAHVYSSGKIHTNGSISENGQICSAFLANIDEHKYVSVWIFGKSYSLPPWSVSILPDCENVAFNTARVSGLLTEHNVSYEAITCEHMSLHADLNMMDCCTKKWKLESVPVAVSYLFNRIWKKIILQKKRISGKKICVHKNSFYVRS